ncbi:hypothetical protein BD779DRAFT_1516184 [Infundibulicybe gibba]|nr:hypothetical protein BD779DRAFT_1516184 [Infundibulicybe gibba]
MAAIRSLLDVPEQIVSILAASLTPFPETLATALAKLEMANIFGPTEIPKILSAMEGTGVPLTIDAILACGDLGVLKTWLDLENLRGQDLLDQLVENSDHIDQYTNLEVKPDSLPTSASLLSSAGSSAPDLSYLNDYSPSLSPPSRMESPSGYPPTSQSPPALLTQEPLPLPLRRSISPNMKFQIPSLAANTLCSKSNLAIRRSNLGSKSSHNSTPTSDIPQTPLFTPIVSWEPLINPGELVVLPGADQASLMPTHRTPTPPSSPLSPPPSSDVELVQKSPISPLAPKLGGKEPTQNIPTCVPTLEPESKVSRRERSASHSSPRLTIPRGRYGLRSASLSERSGPASDTDDLGNGGGIGFNTVSTSALATISTKKAHGKGRAMPSSHATAPRLTLRASRMRAVSSNKENQE